MCPLWYIYICACYEQCILLIIYLNFQLALNNQSRIRQFYANIFHQISNSYSSSIDIKEALFELAHLSLIIHCPNQSISSKIILSHEKWKKMLKLFLHMVESEVKYLNSQNKFNRNPEMDEKFLKFATELCYMVHNFYLIRY